MKKILSVFITVLTLCLCMSAVASAGSWEYKESFKTPIIMENAEAILYQGKTYKTMQNWNFSFAVGDINYVSSKFFDSETEEMYSYFDVAVNEKYDYILHTNHGFRRGYEGGSLYIEETHYDAAEKFANDNGIDTAHSFCTHSQYDFEHEITYEDFSKWLGSGVTAVVSANGFSYCEHLPIYKTDEKGGMHKQIGMILRQVNENALDDYTLIYYPEYERNCFYADGSFAIDSPEIDVTLYHLTDEQLINDLTEFYNKVPKEELDWIIDEKEPSLTVIFAISLVLFGIVPLALIILSVVFIIKKVRKPYFNCYIILAVLSALVIVSFIIVTSILA